MMLLKVDTAVIVPVNLVALIDAVDFKTIEDAVAFDAAGMDLKWNFVSAAGVVTQVAVTPTTAGVYDWTNLGGGMYTIEIPASGGASINNDTEGYGYFTGVATGVLPWRGPTITFSHANVVEFLTGGNLSNTTVGDVSLALANKLAHIILRRTMAAVEASADGEALDVSSLYGFLQMAQQSSRSGDTLTIKKTDGTTTLGTKTLTADASASPITGVG